MTAPHIPPAEPARTAGDVFERLDFYLRKGEPTPVALRHAAGVNDAGEAT